MDDAQRLQQLSALVDQGGMADVIRGIDVVTQHAVELGDGLADCGNHLGVLGYFSAVITPIVIARELSLAFQFADRILDAYGTRTDIRRSTSARRQRPTRVAPTSAAVRRTL